LQGNALLHSIGDRRRLHPRKSRTALRPIQKGRLEFADDQGEPLQSSGPASPLHAPRNPSPSPDENPGEFSDHSPGAAPGCCAARGIGSFGFTPYFRCRARPHGQPPSVMTSSIVCRKRASRFPFLARVQMGQRCSQKSGSNLPRSESFMFLVSHAVARTAVAAIGLGTIANRYRVYPHRSLRRIDRRPLYPKSQPAGSLRDAARLLGAVQGVA
jgi:hypothetical protein